MTRTITVGIDGSPQSHAAAEWAVREAELRDLPVRLLHVWEPAPAVLAEDPVLGAKTHQHWTERVPQKVGDGLWLRHPGVVVTSDQRSGPPADTLVRDADGVELLVLGTRAQRTRRLPGRFRRTVRDRPQRCSRGTRACG